MSDVVDVVEDEPVTLNKVEVCVIFYTWRVSPLSRCFEIGLSNA
jgi:hypothetical protein